MLLRRILGKVSPQIEWKGVFGGDGGRARGMVADEIRGGRAVCTGA